jgi:hypothetical protein
VIRGQNFSLAKRAKFSQNSLSPNKSGLGSGQEAFLPELSSPFQMRTAKGQPAGANEKGKINMKLQNLVLILMGIVCIGLLPNARAVNPAPDGGYPGFNTAEGDNALKNLNTAAGVGNTAVVGFRSSPTSKAASTQPLALEPLRSIPGVQTRALARRRLS